MEQDKKTTSKPRPWYLTNYLATLNLRELEKLREELPAIVLHNQGFPTNKKEMEEYHNRCLKAIYQILSSKGETDTKKLKEELIELNNSFKDVFEQRPDFAINLEKNDSAWRTFVVGWLLANMNVAKATKQQEEVPMYE